MPKKSATARGGAPRTKAKAQKSFELVRPEGSENESTSSESFSPEQLDLTPQSVATATVPPITTTPESVSEVPNAPESVSTGKTSASTRLAARRKAAQKAQQRQATALLTPEHFSYVRRELIIIGSLAVIMFAAIIILYIILG